MAKRGRRSGRTTPKGTRHPHLRPVPDHLGDHDRRDPDPGPEVDHLIDLGAKDLSAEDSPVAAEAWGSHLLGMFDGVRRAALSAGIEAPPFEELLLERCRQRRDLNSLIVAVALGAVASPALQGTAGRVVAELRQQTTGPPWLDDVGQSEPTRAWLATDVFGDQDAIIIGFSAPGTARDHGLVVLVDHNLGGQAKDAWLGEDADDIARAWASHDDPGLQVEPVPIGDALPRLRDAMAVSDRRPDDADLRTDDFAESRALVWARLRRAGLPGGTGDADEAEPEYLVRTGGPGAVGPPPAVIEEIETSSVLARFAALADFYGGDGRKLTATGQPTLADAHALVPLLGTEDRLDEKIGDRVFRTTSAADLPELSFTIRWAIAGGALRKDRGRLRATASWRKLEAKPVERFIKAADALEKLGPLAALYGGARTGFRQMAEFVDEAVPDLLAGLWAGPVPFDTALDVICDEADVVFDWTTGYWRDPASRRSSFGVDLDRLLQVLDWAGLVERTDFTVEPNSWDKGRYDKVGGTIRLTRAGRWWVNPVR